MKTPKIKRYRLGVSRTFPTKHYRRGHSTYFVEQITGLFPFETPDSNKKIHTIRANYKLWEKRMKKVQAGEAVIELFYWEGKTYNSKQVVFATLDKDSGCGVQELDFIAFNIERPCIFGKGYASRNHLSELAKNNGLS